MGRHLDYRSIDFDITKIHVEFSIASGCPFFCVKNKPKPWLRLFPFLGGGSVGAIFSLLLFYRASSILNLLYELRKRDKMGGFVEHFNFLVSTVKYLFKLITNYVLRTH